MGREGGERRQREKEACRHVGKGEEKPARIIFYACNYWFNLWNEQGHLQS